MSDVAGSREMSDVAEDVARDVARAFSVPCRHSWRHGFSEGAGRSPGLHGQARCPQPAGQGRARARHVARNGDTARLETCATSRRKEY